MCSIACDSMDYSPPGSFVHKIFQARLLEWAAISSSRASSHSRDRTTSLVSPELTREFFTSSTTWEAAWETNRDEGRAISEKSFKGFKGGVFNNLNKCET